jgi:hypothetical protein
VELASRLSYFLWSSMPDDELLGLAEKGKLRDPEILHSQLRRMIADPKGQALAANFSGQWLQIRNLDALQRDASRFPEFDAVSVVNSRSFVFSTISVRRLGGKPTG